MKIKTLVRRYSSTFLVVWAVIIVIGVVLGAQFWRAHVVSASGSLSSGMYAYKNYVSQGNIPSNTYTLVTFNTTKSNLGAYFNATTSAWYPPSGFVMLAGQVWVQSGAVTSGNGQFVAKIIKNGNQDVCAGIGAYGSVSGTVAIPVSCVDLASPGDYYQIYFYGTTNSSITIDGNMAHTWFSAVALP